MVHGFKELLLGWPRRHCSKLINRGWIEMKNRYWLVFGIAAIILIYFMVGLSLKLENDAKQKCIDATPGGWKLIKYERSGVTAPVNCYYESVPNLPYNTCRIRFESTEFHGVVVVENTCPEQVSREFETLQKLQTVVVSKDNNSVHLEAERILGVLREEKSLLDEMTSSDEILEWRERLDDYIQKLCTPPSSELADELSCWCGGPLPATQELLDKNVIEKSIYCGQAYGSGSVEWPGVHNLGIGCCEHKFVIHEINDSWGLTRND